MTWDDAFKAIATIVGGILTTLGSYGAKVLMDLKHRVTVMEVENIGLKTKVAEQGAEISELKKEALTVECIREVVDSSLDRRDKSNAERRIEWDKTQSLAIKVAINEGIDQAVERLVPRLVREVRNSTGIMKKSDKD